MNTKKSKVRLWSVLTALTAILTIAAIVGNMIANQYATTLNVALNASTYKIIKGNTTEDTEYFKAGFASDEEREAYEAELCATVEAEGAALLKNDNAALPLAVIGIWEKDQPKYFGIGGEKTEKIKVREYIQIIKNNDPMQRLMVAGAGCKLALSIATNTTVLCMLYGCMMGNYDGLYLPMMVLGYVFSVPFFLLTVRTSQKEGQKASLMKYVSVALVCYVGVLVLLLLWGPRRCLHTVHSGRERPFHQPVYHPVHRFLRHRLRCLLRHRRYAHPHGGRLLRLRDLPQRQVYPRHHGHPVQSGGQAGVQPVRYRCGHRGQLCGPAEPAHPV